MIECRKCGKTLSGIAAAHAHQGGDRLCGVTRCDEESVKCYEPLPVPHETRLRDKFAGQAMAAILNADGSLEAEWTTDQDYMKSLASTAYKVADAMMEARKK